MLMSHPLRAAPAPRHALGVALLLRYACAESIFILQDLWRLECRAWTRTVATVLAAPASCLRGGSFGLWLTDRAFTREIIPVIRVRGFSVAVAASGLRCRLPLVRRRG